MVIGVMTFKEAIRKAAKLDVKLIPYGMAEDMSYTREMIKGILPGQSIAVFIGPEGGFSDEEIAYAKENGVMPVTLGKRILRTETAGMTMMSILMYELEGRD
jgi:16S rRNA (uracil1498-N3)-methyltransferase